MDKKTGKYKVGLAVAALLIGGGYYLHSTAPKAESLWPENPVPSSLPTPMSPESSPDQTTEATAAHQVPVAQPSVPTGAERKRRDKLMEQLTRAFDLEFAAYFKEVMAAHKGEKIKWLHYISASPKLSKEDQARNRAIWDKFYALCQKNHELVVPFMVRMRFYMKFFDVESFGLPTGKLNILPIQDPFDMVPFGYITEVVNPAWYAEYVEVPQDFNFRTEKALKDMPTHIRAFVENKADDLTYHTIPVQGLRHLNGYSKTRADDYGGDTLKMIRKHMDPKGKDLADIGSGCGFTLPLFREAIGPKAKLCAGDMDEYTIDVLKYCSQGTGPEIIQNKLTDCCCGENAYDIINMTGVHLGLMCSNPPREEIEKQVLPWLRSIAKALRPGGLLVIHDGEWPLVERQADKVVEEAGFKKIDFYECHEHSAYIWVFKVKK